MLKLTKQAFWLTSWASSKPLYHPAKLDQDAENIRTSYRSRGYLDMRIEPEVVELESEVKRRESGEPVDADAAELEEEDDFWDDSREEPPPPPGETEKERKKRLKKEAKAAKKKAKKEKKSIYLTIPIDEGIQYRVGEVKIEGNTIFSDPEVMARLPLRTGMVFNDSALKFGTRQLEDDYGERGYFYVSVDPQVSREDGIATLTLDITEDRQYFVDRIEFTGNTTTRDKVLRREMRLGEENLFNVRAMRLGLRKIAQLGYWQVGGDPVVQAKPDSDRLNIEVQGIESSRNEIQVGGGISGIDGGFFQGSYSTRNFLGRGEIFSAFLTIGQVGSRYSLNFTEPWFMGRPWTLGFSLFNQQTQYSGFDRNGTGGRVILGRILGNFSRLDLIYGLEKIDFQPTQPGFVASETTTSSITSIFSYDTRNNFFRPTRGLRSVSSLEYAGGALGGDNNFWKFRQDVTKYFRGLMRKHYFGVNFSYGYVAPIGDSVVPDFERFYLGGERTLRAFPTRSVGPERRDIDLNQNGFIDRPEDLEPDGIFQPCEDLNGNGVQDLPGERDYGNCILDPSEDTNNNFLLDTEDINNNGILDPGEDVNGNGILDSEDLNGDGILQLGEDTPDGFFTAYCPVDDVNMNGIRDSGEGDYGNCRLDGGEDTNLDGIWGSFFPGGNQYVLLNMEYSIPISDTVEFAVFYDAGNAFEEEQSIQFDDLRVDYGIELRFFLPVFQAPLRLIYAIIQDPRPGEDPSNFIFSIGTTF
jgi:outer membrane protein assembly factor BamA